MAFLSSCGAKLLFMFYCTIFILKFNTKMLQVYHMKNQIGILCVYCAMARMPCKAVEKYPSTNPYMTEILNKIVKICNNPAFFIKVHEWPGVRLSAVPDSAESTSFGRRHLMQTIHYTKCWTYCNYHYITWVLFKDEYQ